MNKFWISPDEVKCELLSQTSCDIMRLLKASLLWVLYYQLFLLDDGVRYDRSALVFPFLFNIFESEKVEMEKVPFEPYCNVHETFWTLTLDLPLEYITTVIQFYQTDWGLISSRQYKTATWNGTYTGLSGQDNILQPRGLLSKKPWDRPGRTSLKASWIEACVEPASCSRTSCRTFQISRLTTGPVDNRRSPAISTLNRQTLLKLYYCQYSKTSGVSYTSFILCGKIELLKSYSMVRLYWQKRDVLNPTLSISAPYQSIRAEIT
jgi:hypothetical protein